MKMKLLRRKKCEQNFAATRTFREKRRVDGTEKIKNPSGQKYLKMYGNAVKHRI